VGVSLVTERIWSLRVGSAGGQSDCDDRDSVPYSGIACYVELPSTDANHLPGADERG